MIPLRDTIPSYRPPVLTVSLIITNVVVFLYQFMMSDEQFIAFVYEYGLIPARYVNVTELINSSTLSTYLPFLSNMFLHGNWIHLISNMWILWLFGDNVEDTFGHVKFFVFYILCGLLAGITHILFNQGSQIPAIGASGAIAGIMGAYMILFPFSRITTIIPIFVFFPLFVKIPAVIYLVFWFFSQLYAGAIQSISGRMLGGVGWWAHIGGFAAGVLVQRYFGTNKRRFT